jgi:hypothetical protein
MDIKRLRNRAWLFCFCRIRLFRWLTLWLYTHPRFTMDIKQQLRELIESPIDIARERRADQLSELCRKALERIESLEQISGKAFERIQELEASEDRHAQRLEQITALAQMGRT